MTDDYSTYSHSIRYGLFATMPLFLHYAIVETNLILVGGKLTMVLTAELILQKTATLFGLLPPVFIAIFWILILSFLCLKERKEFGPIDFGIGDIKNTIVEALPFTGILLAFAFGVFLRQPSSPEGFKNILPYLPQLLAMKSGAGFFEEFLCRVILLGGPLWILQKYNIRNLASTIVVILFSSIAFAWLHYFHLVPVLSDLFGIINDPNNPYTFGGFVFRFLSGVLLGYVYIEKGFATSAWTHALYGYVQLFLV